MKAREPSEPVLSDAKRLTNPAPRPSPTDSRALGLPNIRGTVMVMLRREIRRTETSLYPLELKVAKGARSPRRQRAAALRALRSLASETAERAYVAEAITASDARNP